MDTLILALLQDCDMLKKTSYAGHVNILLVEMTREQKNLYPVFKPMKKQFVEIVLPFFDDKLNTHTHTNSGEIINIQRSWWIQVDEKNARQNWKIECI